VLHALAREQRADILAVMVSSGDPFSAPAVSVLNHYFQKPDIPVGRVARPRATHESSYSETLATMFAGARDSYPDSVGLYRKMLAAQPDHSVTIVTIGFLTNLADLLVSAGDQHSPLGGSELVRKKVKLLVCMGGDYPQGKEWNFYQDARSAQQVVKNWPTRIVFVGFSLGLQVLTGQPLREAPESSPVKQVYLLHNQFAGRPSWDQLAVLYAGLDEQSREQVFKTSEPGVNEVSADGSNRWQSKRSGTHYFVHPIEDNKALTDRINDMMQSR